MHSETASELSAPNAVAERIAYRLGQIVQGVVYGCALPLAICKLISLANDTQIFRYQGF